MDPKASNIKLMNKNDERKHACPLCGGKNVRTTIIDHEFSYGSEEARVNISALLPLRNCASCDFEYFDGEAEQIKHGSICNYLGMLRPENIEKIRKSYDMSRAEFAWATGLGEATIGRWENGTVIQNLANDRYIRLLIHPWIMQHVKHYASGLDASPSKTEENVVAFRKLVVTPGVLKQKEGFSLRIAS